MSETITRRVRTVFDADMSAMESVLGRAGAKAYQAEQRVQRLQGAFSGIKQYIAGAVGVMAVKGLVSFNSELESLQLTVASLMNSGDKMRGVMRPFSDSMKEAEDAVSMMRKAAINTPATTLQVAESFKVLALRARAAGMETKGIVGLAANVATKDMMMGGRGLVPMDIEQLLRGQSGQIATPELNIHRQRLAELGRSGQQAKLFSEIGRLLAVGPDEQAAWGGSSEGMFATLKDQWDEFKAEVGKPVMGALISGLKDVLEWLKKNRAAVADVAEFIGSVLGGAFKVVSKLVADFASLFDSKFMKLVATVNILGVAMIGMFTMISKHPVIASLMAAVALAGAIKSELSDSDQEKRSKGLDEYAFARERAREARLEFGATSEEAAFWGKMEAAATRKMAGLINTDESRAFADEFERMQSILGAGFSNEERDAQLAREKAQEAEQQRLREAVGESVKLLVDVTNSATQSLYKMGKLPQAMETNELGLDVIKKGFVSATLLNFDPSNLTVSSSNVDIKMPVDARGSRIALTQRIETNDPSRLAGQTLVGAFVGAFARPLTAQMGLGGAVAGSGRR